MEKTKDEQIRELIEKKKAVHQEKSRFLLELCDKIEENKLLTESLRVCHEEIYNLKKAYSQALRDVVEAQERAIALESEVNKLTEKVKELTNA